ncbi:MAG TPA: condensation domain-containing protein, partial [Chthonomonadaceae bacterium]|nr:condensation domain-containing protein [Chthonomonadaceae bacterium]
MKTDPTLTTEINEAKGEAYELSLQQRIVWRLQQRQLFPNPQVTLQLQDVLDEEALSVALRCIWERHEALRTVFPRVAGLTVPLQSVVDQSFPCWSSHDLRHLTIVEQQFQIEQLAQSQRLTPFDLEHGPLARLMLIHLDTHNHLLLITVPAICMDRRSLKNLAAEVGLFYASPVSGLSQEPPLQYIDYAQWQAELLTSSDADAQTGRGFWNEQPEIAIDTVQYPHTKTFQNEHRICHALNVQVLDPALSAALEALAKQCEVSYGVILETLWGVLLSRWTDTSLLTLGHECEGRSHAELNGAIGIFAKVLPIRFHIDLSNPLLSLFYKADIAIDEATGWQDFHDPEHVGSNEALLYTFAYEEWADTSEPTSFSISALNTAPMPFALGVRCLHGNVSTRLEWQYDSEVYSEDAIHHMALCYEALLRSAVKTPDANLGLLEMAPQVDRDKLLGDWNASDREYGEEVCIHQLFETAARTYPNALALVVEDQQLTFQQLNTRA